MTWFSCFCQPVTPASCLYHKAVLKMKVGERTLRGYKKEFSTHLPLILKYSWHLEIVEQRKIMEIKPLALSPLNGILLCLFSILFLHVESKEDGEQHNIKPPYGLT